MKIFTTETQWTQRNACVFYLSLCALCLCGGFFYGISATYDRSHAQQSDNALRSLVVITIDTLRPDHLECYGYRHIKTPRINDLARDGVLVENAFAPIPLTLPSHASLFTGTYPVFHGVRDFVGFTLNKERITLAEMVKESGYSTGAVVGSAVLEARWGLNQGFDFYYDNFSFNSNRDWQRLAERRGDEVVQQSLGWLQKQERKPFFLWVHLFDPHDPYEPPPPYDRQYRERPYDGEIAYADEQVGKIIDYLKQNSLYDKTLIVLLSDHGEGLGEHGERYHGFFIYDSTLRIPMIFKLPGARKTGVNRVIGPVRIIDVLPTILQILGLANKAGAREVLGRGIYGAMLGKPQSDVASYAEIFLPFYHFDWSPLVSIRKGRYKFIDAPKPELYDTEVDRGETRNLFSEKRAIAVQLRELLRQVQAQQAPGKSEAASRQEVDPATLEKLQSLGYIALSGGKRATSVDKSLPDPKDRIEVYELILEGTRAAQANNYDLAASKLREVVRREPNSPIAHFQLGNVLRVQGALDDAEREFRRSLELKPDQALALRRLAEIYLAGRRYAEAEAAYKKFLVQSPDDFLAHFNLGGLYVLQDRWDEAFAAFRRSQALNPTDSRVPTIIGRILFQRGDLAGALQAAQQAIKLDPDQPEAHQTALEVYRRQGKKAEAEREMQILERLKTRP